MAVTKESLLEMADEKGRIAFTANTRSVLEEAVALRLALPINGMFREVEPGHLNSIYQVIL
jgi:hypothetical protein